MPAALCAPVKGSMTQLPTIDDQLALAIAADAQAFTESLKAGTSPTPEAIVDVSVVASRFLFQRNVLVEQETFGVLVTRRSIQNLGQLTADENSRLLSLLSHATEFMGNCDAEPRQYDLWALPSDAQDGKPRRHWVQMTVCESAYCLTLAQE